MQTMENFSNCQMKAVKLLLVMIVISVIHVETSSFTDQQNLYTYLKPNMDTNIRPALNQSTPLQVILKPLLGSLMGLDEKSQTLHSKFALQLSWVYESLTWNATEHMGIQSIKISSRHVWTPDLVFRNAVDDNTDLDRSDSLKIRVMANGSALWVTGSNIKTSCSVDISKYPFDTQRCKVLFAKIFSSDSEILLLPASNKVFMESNSENEQWRVVDTSVSRVSVTPERTNLQAELVLERRPRFYIMNTIVPVILLSWMNILSFKLSIRSGERIGYCISLLLTYTVLLNTISASMPRVSRSVSYLQVYIIIQLALGVVITTISIIHVRMANLDKKKSNTLLTVYRTLYSCCTLKTPKIFAGHHLHQNCVHPEHSESGVQTSETKNGCMENTEHNELKLEPRTKENTQEEGHNLQEVPADNETIVEFFETICFWFFSILFLLSSSLCFMLMLK